MRATLALVATCACVAQAFVVPSAPRTAAKTAVQGTPFATVDTTDSAMEDPSLAGLSLFERAMADFGKRYPAPYKRGLGPTTKAERWNGRHAMAGWICILATGYAKSHGLLPEGGLDPAVWGQWVIVSTDPLTKAVTTISAERATILIANLHLAAVGVLSAFSKYTGPFDRLLLEEGEKDEAPAGLFVPLRPGLTSEAELLNGRLAMLGLVVTGAYAGITGQDILSVVDQGLGGLLL